MTVRTEAENEPFGLPDERYKTAPSTESMGGAEVRDLDPALDEGGNKTVTVPTLHDAENVPDTAGGGEEVVTPMETRDGELFFEPHDEADKTVDNMAEESDNLEDALESFIPELVSIFGIIETIDSSPNIETQNTVT